jgi:hypothetical protein
VENAVAIRLAFMSMCLVFSSAAMLPEQKPAISNLPTHAVQMPLSSQAGFAAHLPVKRAGRILFSILGDTREFHTHKDEDQADRRNLRLVTDLIAAIDETNYELQNMGARRPADAALGGTQKSHKDEDRAERRSFHLVTDLVWDFPFMAARSAQRSIN